jgi:hypothetical protein
MTLPNAQEVVTNYLYGSSLVAAFERAWKLRGEGSGANKMMNRFAVSRHSRYSSSSAAKTRPKIGANRSRTSAIISSGTMSADFSAFRVRQSSDFT